MKYFIKKLVTLIITLLLISLLTFTAFSVIPGDAALARLGDDATEEQIEAFREEMGLNDPLPVRYVDWLSGAVRGDFGASYYYDNMTVGELLSDRLPVTVMLAVISLLMILICSVPLGLLCARGAGGVLDHAVNQILQTVMAVPSFFLGILLTYAFGLVLHWFQPGQFVEPSESFFGAASYLVFPALAVALPKIAMVVKFLRNAVLSELSKDYVRTAKSRGNSSRRILYVHVLKNAMIPVITFTAMVVAEILAGSIIVEQVFSVPGVGRLLISSIFNRDYPVVQAIVMYITLVVVAVNFLVDFMYQLLDPRVRTSYAEEKDVKKKRNWNLIIGLAITLFFLAGAVIGQFWTPYPPTQMDSLHVNLAPCLAHPMGTDNFGRDIFSRVMNGSGNTFFVAVCTVLIGGVIGTAAGALTGYYGGVLDNVLMRVGDMIMSFPSVLLALIFISLLGPGKYNIILALGIIFIPVFA